MRKQITLEERKAIQLEMLQEIHDFCSSHSIKYSLAYGTLIGAIRHKGYIPWDDDVDIIMPLPDMLRFKKLLNSKNIKYCDVDTEPHYDYGFSRIAHKDSYRKLGFLSTSYGINIDLYPVIGIPDSKDDKDIFFNKAIELCNRRFFFIKWRSRLQRILPISTIPGHDAAMKAFRDFILFSSEKYGSTNSYYVYGGPIEETIETCSYSYDLFESIVNVEFEGHFFNSIGRYDEFLKHYYGDYMQLPPEEERIPYHGGKYYWK